MTNQEMNEKINQIITDFLFPLKKHENSKEELAALSLLLRGFVTCNNDSIEKRPFLLTGINPSFGPHDGEWKFFPGGYDGPFTFREAISNSQPQDYWGKKRVQFGDDLCKTMAYLDLFPTRENDQRLFEQVFKNSKLTKLRADILSITQDAIEAMAPRLIVHANKESLYYWGIKKNTPAGDDANDYEHPWMGYKVKRVTLETYPDLPPCMLQDDRLSLFPLYEIVGFVDSDKRINHIERQETNLKFIMEYVIDDRNPKYNGKLYQQNKEKKEWVEIWEWVKKQSPAD